MKIILEDKQIRKALGMYVTSFITCRMPLIKISISNARGAGTSAVLEFKDPAPDIDDDAVPVTSEETDTEVESTEEPEEEGDNENMSPFNQFRRPE